MPIADLLPAATDAAAAAVTADSPAASLFSRLTAVVSALDDSDFLPDSPEFHHAVDSLAAELTRAKHTIASSSPIERSLRGLRQSLGLLLLSSGAATSAEVQDAIASLRRDLKVMAVGEKEKRIMKYGIGAKIEDLMVRLKSGEEASVMELEVLVEEGGLSSDEEDRVVQALLNQLAGSNSGNRSKILAVLKILAARSNENKEGMSSIGTLTTISRSLARHAEERREAVGLLLDLSAVEKVRQRIGRVQGCILMLVALLNGEDEAAAACDAGTLLGILSSNTQNVLLMAEAGFFCPMVQYLKEGSEMNKVLMATAVSRMEMTEQMKAALGAEGSIESLVKMFINGKLEAKMAALDALRNLSSLTENIQRLIDAGIVGPLLHILFSVTSVLMTIREPASAVLASVAQSEKILFQKNVPGQMLSLLSLSSPAIQFHLMQALNRMACHPDAQKVRAKMRKHGALQLVLPFLTDSNNELKMAALSFLFSLSEDFAHETSEQLGDDHLKILVDIVSTSTSENEKAVAVGILSNLPVTCKKATEKFMKANLLPILISLAEQNISSSPTSTSRWFLESITRLFIRFTVPSDKKLQRTAVTHGIIPCLLKILSSGTSLAKSRAATSLGQLSQNSLSLSKVKTPRWFCVPASSDLFCQIHGGACSVRTTFCLAKAGAIGRLVQILEGKDREADEAVLDTLSSLVQDETWENGCNAIEKASGVQAIIRILDVGSVKAQAKAIWILERIFRIGAHTDKYGQSAQVFLVDLAQNGDPSIKPMVAKTLAHLQLLQMQSSYF